MQHATCNIINSANLHIHPPITLAHCDGKMSGRKVYGMPTSYTISDARQCVNENTCIDKYINMFSTRQPNRRTVIISRPDLVYATISELNQTFDFFKLCTHTHLLQIIDWYVKYNFNFSRICGEEDFSVPQCEWDRLTETSLSLLFVSWNAVGFGGIDG